MSNQHSGNMLNSINYEEHDGSLNAKKVSMVSGVTIFAVVNTGAAGGQASVVVDGIKGNVTLDRGSLTGIVGNLTLSDSKTYIGLTTSTLGAGDRYIGLVTSTNVGLQTLAPSPNYIGLVSVGGGIIEPRGNVTISDSKGFIGLTTTVNAASPAFIGIVTVTNRDMTVTGNLTLSDSKGFIGLTTTTLGASPAFIGIVTVTNKDRTITGNLTLTDSKGFIGLTTSVIGSAATIFAVVNTGAAGQASVVIDTGLNWIGFATVANATAWPDPKGYIGLVTITGALSAAAGNVTLDDGSLTGIVGNITLDDGSLTGIVGNLTLTDSKGFIGLTTSTLGASPAFIGIVTVTNKDRTITGNLTLSDSKTFIGLATTINAASPAFIGIVTITNKDRTITGNLTLSDSKGYIGLVSIGGGLSNVAVVGNLTLSDSKGFIGLVTAITKNGGTTKTLIHKNIAFAQASIVTIAVPTNTFYITHLLLNANATTRVNIKSGASYLTGNVSLGINLNPGGGWVENGSPDSPVYIGLAGAAAIVVEKLDLTGTSAQIGGKLIYYDE